MKLNLLAASCVLSGCSYNQLLPLTMQPDADDIKRHEFPVVLLVDETLNKRTGNAAYADISGEACVIVIDPRYYTHECLGHELRHCIEGWWHGDKPTPC